MSWRIGAYEFPNCTSLPSIVVPNTIKRIKDGTFSCCMRLMIVTLGDGLEEIGECVFMCCTSLR